MRPRDEGLTLVELLIAMAITIMLLAPLATSFVLGLSSTRANEQDAGNSSDAQLLASFFDIDVASAERRDTTITCGTGGTAVLQLSWTDGAAQSVVYRAVPNATRKSQLNVATEVYDLQRVRCSDGTQTSIDVVARTLASPPTVTCENAEPCTDTPRQITLKAEAYSTQVGDTSANADRFTFGVTATRRVQP